MQIGVDEAGRGPLAGPVCAAAVILDDRQPIEGLRDSKKLSSRRREALAETIRQQSLAWGIGWADVQEIDQHDILRATFMAMARAVKACLDCVGRSPHGAPGIRPQEIGTFLVQVDGNHSPGSFEGPWEWPYATEAVIKGDEKLAHISAASILAKTARDTEMQKLDQRYPGYGFAQHAGYGTATHLQALKRYGPCPAHRRSFAPVARLLAPSADA